MSSRSRPRKGDLVNLRAPTGERGRWTAKVLGFTRACVRVEWLTGPLSKLDSSRQSNAEGLIPEASFREMAS